MSPVYIALFCLRGLNSAIADAAAKPRHAAGSKVKLRLARRGYSGRRIFIYR